MSICDGLGYFYRGRYYNVIGFNDVKMLGKG